MARIGMLLIATMLTGGPAAPLVCELWCGTPAAAGHHRVAGCHDGADGLPTNPQIASAGSCHDDAAVIPPYLTETRLKESSAVLAALPLDDATAIAAGPGAKTAAWCALDLQPRHRFTNPLVLRI